MSALRVLLITNRPSAHAFLDEHGARSIPRISAASMPLSVEAVALHAREIQEAQAAMIDVGADPDTAVLVCQELHRVRPDLRVLVVVCCPNPTMPWHVRALLSNGVHEMLDSQTTPSELIERLVSLVERRHAVRVALHRDFGVLAHSSLEPLGRDEQRLLEMVANGLSDVDIGLRLQLGERTVRDRVRALRQTLLVKNREELAAWAGANGYYQPRRHNGALVAAN
jgi:DNA-binding NarL/FixJ family response regulator